MADSVLQETLQALQYAIPIVQASQYMTLSGCSLLLYDYFLTFSQEVEFIWKAPKSTISMIYLANRYIIPPMLAVDIYDRLGLAGPHSPHFCKVWIWLEGYMTVLSFMSMHGLVAMRVHALFGGGRPMKILLWATWVLYAFLTLGLLGHGLWRGQGSLTVEPIFNTCFEEISSMLWTVWLPSLLFESLLFFLTTLKAIREARRNIYHPISSILYRDGIMYFLAISVATMFSMFTWLFAPPLYEGLAKYWATAVVNVAGCRLVLSLKMNARALQIVRNQSTDLGQSSFLVGSELFEDSGYEDTDWILLSELPRLQIGTVYPEQLQTHWEAL